MENKRNRRKAKPDTQTVYTPPKAFNRRRLGLQIVTVVAVVLALVFGMSIFFKVETVRVAGVEKYTEYQVKEASGIQKGENIMGLSRSAIASRIMQKLPYVSSVQVGKTLPGTVKIAVKEVSVTYAICAQDGSWWLMSAEGKILEKINAGDATAYTNVVGVTLDNPEVSAQAVAYEPGPQENADGELEPVVVYAGEKLDTALKILQLLEDQGILGEAASLDVTQLDALQMQYKDQFQISLGDTSRLDYKLTLIKGAIDEIGPYRTGSLDVSFSIRPNEVIFTPAE